MKRICILMAFTNLLAAQALDVLQIKDQLQANPLAGKILLQPPSERTKDEFKELFAGKLEIPTLILKKMGVRFHPKDSRTIRRELFETMFPKINPPAAAASANASASTSAVSSTGVPMVLGLALERGGITQSTKGSVLTLKGNLLGLARGIGASDVYCVALECGAKEDLLRRFTFGVGFDTTRNATESGSATNPANNQNVNFNLRSAKEQFDNVSIRFDLENRRDIRGKRFHAEWQTQLKDSGIGEAAAKLRAAQGKLVTVDVQSKAQIPLDEALKKFSTIDEMAAAIDAAVSAAAAHALNLPGIDASKKEFDAAYLEYNNALDKAARAAVQKFSHAIEFTYTRPKNQPELANLRYVGSGGFGANEEWRGTINAALDFYASKAGAPDVGTFRDVQLSAQLDRVFFAKRPLSVTWSLAGYYQWMKERALIVIPAGDIAPGTNIPLAGPAVTLLAPEGNIGLAQCKFTFAVRDTKFKFPLSFTYANRTELIKPTHKVWGGQFGISYDFDSLFKP